MGTPRIDRIDRTFRCKAKEGLGKGHREAFSQEHITYGFMRTYMTNIPGKAYSVVGYSRVIDENC